MKIKLNKKKKKLRLKLSTNFLYCKWWQGNHVALLSAFTEMGFKLRLDMPEQVMDITSLLFCNSAPTPEAFVSTLSDLSLRLIDFYGRNI